MAVLYDLGAEGGIPKKWISKNFRVLFPKIEIVAFDLDDTKLSKDYSHLNLKLIDKIICDTEGVKNFYIPIRHSGSSLFQFNQDYSYLHHEKYHHLDKIVEVETTTLGNLISDKKIPPADLIKMDIQGAELSALKGLGDHLSKVSVLEIEVEFIPIYQNQPTFVDVHSFLTQSNFHLQDLHLSKSFLTDGRTKDFYLKKSIGVSKNVNWTPQVYAGDVIYVKDAKTVLNLNLEEQIHHIKCLCAYNCFDRAFFIISKSKYKSEIERSEFYKDLLVMAKQGRLKTTVLKILSKMLRIMRIPVSPIFDKNHPWIKRKFPNL